MQVWTKTVEIGGVERTFTVTFEHGVFLARIDDDQDRALSIPLAPEDFPAMAYAVAGANPETAREGGPHEGGGPESDHFSRVKHGKEFPELPHGQN